MKSSRVIRNFFLILLYLFPNKWCQKLDKHNRVGLGQVYPIKEFQMPIHREQIIVTTFARILCYLV